MLKIHLYPHAPQHVHDTISEYRNSVPFSINGMAKHCELVGPDRADYFYMGQFADKHSWMLHPNRFRHFKGNEARHIIDIEGDYRDMDIPEWLKPCMITAMNATERERDWRVFVRPGCSMLLMDMVRRGVAYEPPEKIGFYFRGQRDSGGVREKVRHVLEILSVPHEFEFTDRWNAPTPADDPEVRKYVDGMRRWSFALCPAGNGQMTVRFYEACALGRIPVVVADNLWFEDDATKAFKFQFPAGSTAAFLVGSLRYLIDNADYRGHQVAREYFNQRVRRYFLDPTSYFLACAREKGWI